MLPSISDILLTCVKKNPPQLSQKVEALHTLYSYADQEGNIIVPDNIGSLIHTFENFYQQPEEKISDQRGAIVELFGRKLICPRYNNNECRNSGGFNDDQGRQVTLQEVDIAALSGNLKQLEAYECKIKSSGLASDDCVDLAYLKCESGKCGYQANVGIISFEPTRMIQARLRRLNADPCIQSYGLDNLLTLRDSPFQ